MLQRWVHLAVEQLGLAYGCPWLQKVYCVLELIVPLIFSSASMENEIVKNLNQIRVLCVQETAKTRYDSAAIHSTRPINIPRMEKKQRG